MVFKVPFFYCEGDDTPHCPVCWEGKGTAVHVTFEEDNDTATYWRCPSCKHQYTVRKQDAPQSQPWRRLPFRGGRHSWMG